MPRIRIAGLLTTLALSIAALSTPTQARDASFFAREPVHAWHGQHFTIVRIDSLDRFDGLRAMLENWTSSFPDQMQALQAAIHGNRPLAAALQARGVQIGNIAAIQQGFDGNLIFYLR
jgi:hypothetical protein